MVSPAPRNVSNIRLKLPALADPLPDYIVPYREADEPVLQSLLAAMLNLIQDAEEMLDWHRVAKRLECYRFDHLSFSQKFVRFNSTTKHRVSEGIYKSFREIGECERRLSLLNEQLDVLNNELLPAAKRNAELKQAHREWPRPGRFPTHLDRIDDPNAPADDIDTIYLGEGITRRIYHRTAQLDLPPTALNANGYGLYDRASTITEEAVDAMAAFDDNYLNRLSDEIRRLRIARGLRLRLLSLARIGADDADIDGIRSSVNDLNQDLVTAAQAFYESNINSLPPEQRGEECLRISDLSDYQYSAEVFLVAEVNSWTLTARDEDAAEHELRHVIAVREAMADAEDKLVFDLVDNEQRSGWRKETAGAVFLSLEDVDSAFEAGPDAIVVQILRLQRILEEKEASLKTVKRRYNSLSATQKYVRRKESKSWKTLQENKVTISQDTKNLRVSIQSLREKLKACSLYTSLANEI